MHCNMQVPPSVFSYQGIYIESETEEEEEVQSTLSRVCVALACLEGRKSVLSDAAEPPHEHTPKNPAAVSLLQLHAPHVMLSVLMCVCGWNSNCFRTRRATRTVTQVRGRGGQAVLSAACAHGVAVFVS